MAAFRESHSPGFELPANKQVPKQFSSLGAVFFDKTEGTGNRAVSGDELRHVVSSPGRKNWGDGGMTTLTQCQQQVLDMLISYQKERGFRQPIRRWLPCWDTVQ